MTEEKTIASVAQEMLDNFEYKTRTDGSKYSVQKSPSKEWITNICCEAHGDRLPSDDVYEVIVDVLEGLTECDNENDAEDRINEIESDIYTHDLTGWLHSNNNNVYYLTQALDELNIKDGFLALSTAQYLWKQEIAHTVLREIVAIVNE